MKRMQHVRDHENGIQHTAWLHGGMPDAAAARNRVDCCVNNARAAEQRFVVNVASQEYFQAVGKVRL